MPPRTPATPALHDAVVPLDDGQPPADRAASRQLAAVLETGLVGISYTENRHIVWINDRYATLTGWRREELIGQSTRIFYDSDEAWQADGVNLQAALARDGHCHSERLVRRRDGRAFPAVLAGRCVEAGRADGGVVWTLLDTTERQQAEADRRAALAQQQAFNDLRSRFVAMTSDGLRTPLASILSSAELLRHYGNRMDAAEAGNILQTIEDSVQRMTRLLDRVLMAEAESHTLAFAPRTLDLAALCHRLVDEARNQHPDSPCHVQVDLAPDVGVGAFDGQLLQHIFGNLLSNAIKYSPLGGTVRFRVVRHGGRTVFTVSDEGIGVPPDELPHLFESFRRASNVGDIPGSGVGLAIVKKSVELHRGQITVDSRVGVGTTFTVTL